MAKGKDEESRFLRDIDRLLAGEEALSAEEATDDYRSAVDFARKLSEMSQGPSSAFQAQLKERLLQRLTEQEAAAEQGGRAGWLRDVLDRLFPRSPVWRTAVATVVIVAVTAGVLWGSGVFTTAPGAVVEKATTEETEMVAGKAAPSEALVPRAGTAEDAQPEAEMAAKEAGLPLTFDLRITATAAVATVPQPTVVSPYGSEVPFNIVILNAGSQPATVTPFPPSVTIVEQTTMRAVLIFEAGTGAKEIAPSESAVVPFVWKQLDGVGIQVPPGSYRVVVSPFTVSVGTEQFQVSPPSAEVLVAEP
jgi:hypothetical protein